MSMHVGKQQNYTTSQSSSQSQFGSAKQDYQKQGSGAPGGFFKKNINKEEKKKLKCSRCQGMGHEVDVCFKLYGIPKWYTKYKENRSQPRAYFAKSGMSNESNSGRIE